ncbi:MAG TPA: glycoside hydrolase family 15 protein, partial [Planctomycetaceae bacterium]|nr:glycoside hydrolase family 15 protein [Planctomycetaceae bacterium]
MTLPTPTDLAARLHPQCSRREVIEVREFLQQQGTFRFPTLNSGLFSASANDNEEFAATGYRNAWVRDTVHIAHVLWRTDQPGMAVRAVESLMTYFQKYRHRFADIIEGRADANDPQQRPHIRFDGDRLEEVDEKWSHAQNDALGAFFWLYLKMVAEGTLRPSPAQWDMLADFPAYFRSVRYWEDEDSGHWEETRKIAASSIGIVVGALRLLQTLLTDDKCDYAWSRTKNGVGGDELAWLQQQGEAALKMILPYECLQPDPTQHRRYDSALLFLSEPFGVVTADMAAQIADDVRNHLMGPIGIRRYLGDSYWCADYKDKLSVDERTADFSDNLAERNRLLEPGTEAQWCLFDPTLSVIYARRFAE